MPADSPAALHDETDRDESGKKKGPFRFAGRVLLFFTPLLLVIALLESALWKTGETWPIPRVIRAQAADPKALFMRGLLDQGFFRYKTLQLTQRQPRIVTLGSSRVMEFRSELFGLRGAEFFNGGGLIQDLSDLDAYADTLSPAAAPEVILLGLDFWWFNGSKPLARGLQTGTARDAAYDWQEHVRVWRRFKSKKTRQQTAAALSARNGNIGLEARAADAGFRHDGSMKYNFAREAEARGWEYVDRENPPIAERIRQGAAQFPAADGASAERLALLGSVLDKLAAKGVLVAGFLPPVASEIAAMLAATPGQSNLWTEVRREVPKIFRERSLPFVDSSTPGDLALSDSCMVDGIHAAETFQLHVLARLLASERFANFFPGLAPKIGAALDSARTNPWEPDYTPLKP